jgi:sulfur-oxidizing protein SoxY
MLRHSGAVAAALAGLGLLPVGARAAWPKAAFEMRNLADTLKALGAATPVESRDVTITGPEISENGAEVPVTLATSLAGVRRMLLLVEKNPAMLCAVFEPTESVEANFGVRIKMAESSNVYAVALLADGRVLFARREIKVTLGGCAA